MPARSRWLWIALLAPACVAYPWLIHAFIVDVETISVRVALAVLNGIPHAAFNIFLLWVFARTLKPGREALVTGFARRIHGSLTVPIESYTRRVTLAWCVFFALQVLLSAILFAAGSLETWSFFVNVLGFPLVVLMFGAEYLYRIVRFPDHPHVSIWKGIQLFVGQDRDPRPTEVRSL